MPAVYVAGNITGLSYEEATGWREAAGDLLEEAGFEVRDPMRKKEHLIGESYLPHVGNFADPFPRDTHDIRQSDIILARLHGDQLSVGTLVELGYAKGCSNKLTVVCAETEYLREHPFITGCADYLTDDLHEAVEYVVSLAV